MTELREYDIMICSQPDSVVKVSKRTVGVFLFSIFFFLIWIILHNRLSILRQSVSVRSQLAYSHVPSYCVLSSRLQKFMCIFSVD